MRVIGTAGHVDHGKSTLVSALTGINPDRLKEEQQREMTIELGFAWMTLPDGEQVGIVDVPGHRDFIENMLAGVGGIDAVIFVVAADEGVMPQTREHLAILNILQIPAGVVALTKVDMVSDLDWLDLVENDLRTVLHGTVLQDASILRVSARNGTGLAELVQTLQKILKNSPGRSDLGRPRLPVDRVFSMPGFGTVVTGTLLDGEFHVGDEVVLLPGDIQGRIRGLQTHKKKEQTAYPGSRTAINLNGIELEQVRRGDVLSLPGKYLPTQRIDVYFSLLQDANHSLKHDSTVKFFSGASESQARVRLLGSEEIKPGESGWLQLELLQPVVVVRSDRYILRLPSPGETLGGGEVVDPHPKERHKRFAAAALEGLEVLRGGSAEDVILQAGQALGISPLKDILSRSRLSEESARAAIQTLVQAGELKILEAGNPNGDLTTLAAIKPVWEETTRRALRELEQYHHANPLRLGMSKEELKSRLKLPQRVFQALLQGCVNEKMIEENGPLVRMKGFALILTPMQQRQVDDFLAGCDRQLFMPPTIKEAQAALGEDLAAALVELQYMEPISEEIIFRPQGLKRVAEEVTIYLKTHSSITVAEFRDLIHTSRKYAVPLMEYLDAQGVTVREGDVRRLKSG